ncbi:MAG: hypothetical protein RJA22_1254 [Verrucomicrobiota bacterium]
MLSIPMIRCGGHPTPPLVLRAGPLSLLFEPDTAFLRQVRLGDHEVVRAVYAAVRDQNWATIPPVVRVTTQEVGPDGFRLAFEVRCRRGPVDYAWQGVVTGEATGRIHFSFDGLAHSQFQRNRIGLCILHPVEECSGREVTVEHTDGTVESGRFPREISPHQPFFDVRAVSHAVANTGITARLEMEGDVFEMEDQRNWSDASFKTYCTPQARPKPQAVQPGDRVQQSFTLTLAGNVRPILPVNVGRPPQLSLATTPVFTLPPLGLAVASHGRPLSAQEAGRLQALRLGHLRVDLRLSDPAHPRRLEQAAAEAEALGCGLHVGLVLTEGSLGAIPALLGQLARQRPRVLLWILLHETEQPIPAALVEQVRPLLQAHDPGILFAAGTLDFFTEVNRCRPPAGSPAAVCYSNNPQVHAFDNLTLVENLAGQVANVESARHFTARPVVVSPITLRIRQNAGAAGEVAGALTELPGDVDPRQLSLLGAGWTLASMAHLAATGFVHSLTYFETTGWRGVLQDAAGSPLPGCFPSEPGMVFPVYHVLADIAEFQARQVHPTHSTHPLLADGLTLVDGRGRRRVLAANLSAEPQELKIKTGTGTARVRYLDETNATEAMRQPEGFRQQAGETVESAGGKIALALRPFAVARVDLG